jgi:hypothetical protein
MRGLELPEQRALSRVRSAYRTARSWQGFAEVVFHEVSSTIHTPHSVPRFVKQEFHAFLRCGILAHGFLRLHCDRCGFDRLVPFSCKRRGFCPSGAPPFRPPRRSRPNPNRLRAKWGRRIRVRGLSVRALAFLNSTQVRRFCSTNRRCGPAPAPPPHAESSTRKPRSSFPSIYTHVSAESVRKYVAYDENSLNPRAMDVW